MGRKSLVSDESAEFLIQSSIRADRANDGHSQTEVINNVMELHPELNPVQSKNWVQRTWKNKHEGRLKPRPIKAQKTTSKRSQCTVAQQYRWFKNYEKALTFLREKNTGLCRLTGKSFGELIDYFVCGADETCMAFDDQGNLKVYGEAGRKKHEKKAGDFCGSITMYRLGTPMDHNGPTAFIMKGKNRKKGMTNKFLIDEGCAVGSTIAMTENAFMTDAAWQEITDQVGAVVYVCIYLAHGS